MTAPRLDLAKFGARGKPVRALLVLLGGWVLVRAVLWQSPIAALELAPQMLLESDAIVGTVLAVTSRSVRPLEAGIAELADAPAAEWQVALLRPTLLPAFLPKQISVEAKRTGIGLLAIAADTVSAGEIVGQTSLLAAGLAHLHIDPKLLPLLPGGHPLPQQPVANAVPEFAPIVAERFAQETAGARRWSMDAWALWREDDNSPLLSGRPSYGRSQIGAVLRYRLVRSSPQAPQAHLRASAALDGASEQEAALGLSARPLPGVPIRLAGEVRLREARDGGELRAAAYAVSEFPPLALPVGTTGEVYVQAGYVSGSNATGFVDGQARITRDMAVGNAVRLSAGGGAWGGAQTGSGRLDIGPSASVSVSAGGLNARMSADYRFRVAGAAQPASGPTLTISAGF